MKIASYDFYPPAAAEAWSRLAALAISGAKIQVFLLRKCNYSQKPG
jgi:hypothetical protein